MIQIKQRGTQWRIKIIEEEWEFKSRKDMEKALKEILDSKEKGGNINILKE